MKKLALIILTLIITSCSVDEPNYKFTLLPIKESTVPQSFKFGETATIEVTYDIPNGCYGFHSLYYQYDNTSRIVAIRAIVNTETVCNQTTIEKKYKFPVKISQREDYLFKFWKGKDNNGKDIFEEKEVPVN